MHSYSSLCTITPKIALLADGDDNNMFSFSHFQAGQTETNKILNRGPFFLRCQQKETSKNSTCEAPVGEPAGEPSTSTRTFPSWPECKDVTNVSFTTDLGQGCARGIFLMLGCGLDVNIIGNVLSSLFVFCCSQNSTYKEE